MVYTRQNNIHSTSLSFSDTNITVTATHQRRVQIRWSYYIAKKSVRISYHLLALTVAKGRLHISALYDCSSLFKTEGATCL